MHLRRTATPSSCARSLQTHATFSTSRRPWRANRSLSTVWFPTAAAISMTFHPWQRILGTGRLWTRGQQAAPWVITSMSVDRSIKGTLPPAHAQVWVGGNGGGGGWSGRKMFYLVVLHIRRMYRKATSIRQAPQSITEKPMEVYYLDEWSIITLHVAGFLHPTMFYYFHHSSDNSGWKVNDCTAQSAEYWCFYGTVIHPSEIVFNSTCNYLVQMYCHEVKN